MVVIENKDVSIGIVASATDPGIPRTQVTISDVLRKARIDSHGRGFTVPRTILAMSCNDDPFFTQRMPALLPTRFTIHPLQPPASTRLQADDADRMCRKFMRELRSGVLD